MPSQAESSSPQSQHLAAAQNLLDELQAVTQRPETDPQVKATAAAAHAVLVLAEQVAVIRVLLVGDAVSRRAETQPPPQP